MGVSGGSLTNGAMTLPVLDLCVLVGYIAGVVGLGCWFVRRSGTTAEFTAAGGALPGWAVGLSVFGTFVSSISFLANPGKSYESDWNPFVFSLSLPLAALIATRFFVPFYRRMGEVSAYRHLEQRFGIWAREYAVICYLLTQVARVGTILYLVALAVAPLVTPEGVDRDQMIIILILATGALVILYTLLGGIEAVIWTDVVQSLVLVAGLAASVAVLFARMPGGPGELFAIAAERGKFQLGSFGPSLVESTFWVVLIYGLFINLQNFGIDQNYVQRYATARSDGAAARSVWLGALLYVPISAVLFFVGTALFAFYSAQPGQLPEGIKPDAVFPHFIVTELPAGVTGLLIAAILAAAMSTVDSSLNSSATVTLEDFYRRFVRPGATEQQAMRVLYAATIGWGILGTGAALAMTRAKTVLDVWWQLAGLLGGGMLGLFLLGRVTPRAGRGAAIAGVVAGLVAILWMTFSPTAHWPTALSPYRSPFHALLTIVVGTLTILVVGGVASLVWPRREEAGRSRV
jgi:SSS family solute:Na+ symporter